MYGLLPTPIPGRSGVFFPPGLYSFSAAGLDRFSRVSIVAAFAVCRLLFSTLFFGTGLVPASSLFSPATYLYDPGWPLQSTHRRRPSISNQQSSCAVPSTQPPCNTCRARLSMLGLISQLLDSANFLGDVRATAGWRLHVERLLLLLLLLVLVHKPRRHLLECMVSLWVPCSGRFPRQSAQAPPQVCRHVVVRRWLHLLIMYRFQLVRFC
jgi:hypothetical protein